MKLKLALATLLSAVAVFGTAWVCFAAGKPATAADPATLAAMKDELGRSTDVLSKTDPPVYFISYTVTDHDAVSVSGSNGALLSSSEDRGR